MLSSPTNPPTLAFSVASVTSRYSYSFVNWKRFFFNQIEGIIRFVSTYVAEQLTTPKLSDLKQLLFGSLVGQFNLGSAQCFFCSMGTCIYRPQSMSEASAAMAVIGEKPGPFSMGPSLYLEYHPKVG